ncbi:ABC transporter ATP-binding protein [Bavariicoccus seileri]|uniref:ABC transporter ATP-binding protein n=1 Tax=Bavariicoccus seileri TaxID=549685 RepID=UPI003F92D1D9
MKIFMPFFKPYRRQALLAPLYKWLEALTQLIVPYFIAQMIDHGIAQDSLAILIRYSLILIILAIFGVVAAVTAQYYSAQAAVGFATDLRSAYLRKVQTLSMSDINSLKTATLITRITSDINQIQTGVNIFFRLFMRSPFIVIGTVVMAFLTDTSMGWRFLLITCSLFIIILFILGFTIPLYHKVQSQLDQLTQKTDETLTGVRVLRAFNKEDSDYQSFTTINRILTSLQQRVAIVGPTGCGKTTLINLMMRFYDSDSGFISIDGIDIKTVLRSDVRRLFGMVLQDTWLKNGTINENLTLGNPNASADDIKEACIACHADFFIQQLPNGYDTLLDSKGDTISQGQKQLLCIARAMIAQPKMLILDEATSSIDSHTEQLVQKAFHRLMENKTSIVIAHRLKTIVDADLIVAMKDGQVIEQGTHEESLEARGFYYDLYESQFS